ncbi:DNA-binding helix-turn-helix protein [Streptococcus downei F0415]|nr:helix-turn-helix transcriptional regulator [Streptococcus downei]EFQ58308.1 DNA-binding helix-turn-helix protein [Streptococcus downei F0415]
MMAVGQQLQSARLLSDLTQEEVADSLGVSRQTVSNWERGKTYPDIVSLIALSNLYHLSLDQLVKGDEAMVKHLEKTTDLVTSNRNLIWLLGLYLLLFFGLLFLALIFKHDYLIILAVLILLLGMGAIFYQIIRMI